MRHKHCSYANKQYDTAFTAVCVWRSHLGVLGSGLMRFSWPSESEIRLLGALQSNSPTGNSSKETHHECFNFPCFQETVSADGTLSVWIQMSSKCAPRINLPVTKNSIWVFKTLFLFSVIIKWNLKAWTTYFCNKYLLLLHVHGVVLHFLMLYRNKVLGNITFNSIL